MKKHNSKHKDSPAVKLIKRLEAELADCKRRMDECCGKACLVAIRLGGCIKHNDDIKSKRMAELRDDVDAIAKELRK